MISVGKLVKIRAGVATWRDHWPIVLNTSRTISWFAAGGRFKAISFLRRYDDYEIESHNDLSVPHDPKV